MMRVYTIEQARRYFLINPNGKVIVVDKSGTLNIAGNVREAAKYLETWEYSETTEPVLRKPVEIGKEEIEALKLIRREMTILIALELFNSEIGLETLQHLERFIARENL